MLPDKSGLNRGNRLLPLRQGRRRRQRRRRTGHALRGFIGMLDRVLDGAGRSHREGARLRVRASQAIGARDQKIAEHVVAPVRERCKVDGLPARLGGSSQRRHVAIARGGDQLHPAAEEARENTTGRITRALSVSDAAIGLPATDCGVGCGWSDASPLVLTSMNTAKPLTFAPRATAWTTDADSAMP